MMLGSEVQCPFVIPREQTKLNFSALLEKDAERILQNVTQGPPKNLTKTSALEPSLSFMPL